MTTLGTCRCKGLGVTGLHRCPTQHSEVLEAPEVKAVVPATKTDQSPSPGILGSPNPRESMTVISGLLGNLPRLPSHNPS